MKRLWAFNRRLVDDQMVWVEAETLSEARSRAETGDVHTTTDPSIVSLTFRRVPEEDEMLAGPVELPR